VVLLDIGLPVMNGYEVCRALRREPHHGTIRIVALTGWGQERDRQRATEAGFDAHLVKPVDPAALAALLTAGPAPPRAGH
jgi:CheY-like chemotaxis protein